MPAGELKPDAASANPFIFPSADVDLKVIWLDKPVIGKVSSSALSLASPIWAKFVHPPWNPSTKPVDSIDCLEDDGPTLALLMNIAHLRFEKVPEILQYQELYDLAIMCDKYDCVGLVRPWIVEWRKNLIKDALSQGQEGWLFIAWVFGDIGTFENLARHLLNNINVEKDGEEERITIFGSELPEPMPLGIVESILEIRLEVIQSLLEIISTCLRGFKEAREFPICKVKTIPDSSRECDGISYGALTLHLAHHDLSPLPDVKDVKRSILALATNIQYVLIYRRVPVKQQDPIPKPKPESVSNNAYPPYVSRPPFSQPPPTIPTQSTPPQPDHSGCGFPNLSATVWKICDNIRSPVLDVHTAYMKAVNLGL